MEGSVGSGGVLKKKSSSGCLIIKNKVDRKKIGATGGFNSSQQKRPRMTVCDSSSGDEDESLEQLRRKVREKRNNNGSMGHTKSGLARSEKNSSNLFEFDEYDEFDGEKMKNNHLAKRFQMAGGGKSQKFGVDPSVRNVVEDKVKKGMHFVHSSKRKRKTPTGGIKDRALESEDEETQMSVSSSKLKYQEFPHEPIRLQGRNGVLKVLVNKKKVDFPSLQRNNDRIRGDHREVPSSENAFKNTVTKSTVFYDAKPSKNRGCLVEKKKSDKNTKECNSKKETPVLTNNSEDEGFSADDSDSTLKLGAAGSQGQNSKKREKEKEISPFPVNKILMKENKGKIEKSKSNGSTEKQMLREKIRKMLIDSGWTIDYRPRRNRDYLDAVYINPSGTAYWSIIKAYDAFRKQQEEDSCKTKIIVESPSFAPLSEDLLNKLTRQTKKKIKEQTKSKVKLHRDSEDDLSDESPKRYPKKARVEKSAVTTDSNIIPGRTSKVIGRCTLLARGSDKGESSYSDGYVPYTGKRTVLSWLIDSGAAKLSEKVQYMHRRRNKVMLEGWITRDGIHCSCCSKILTVAKFELHAGSKLRQPFQNIHLESGDSLLQCQIEAWNKQGESMRQDFHNVDVDGGDPDDDTCGICGDGGDLICCDRCPSTFHQVCLEIKMLPSGDWHCPNCTCRYCGDTIAVNASEEPIKCICCEKKYHKSCCETEFTASLNSNDVSICGKKCQEIYDHLHKILGVKHELEAGYTWSLIRRKDVSDTSNRHFSQRVECNSKLAVALSVMDECFLPIFDRRSGINIMRSVVYNCGSNFNRLNYNGFYTAILERGDEIISAASIRIHGMDLAEMPFIGTREIYRRQGMCRRLLSAIETALASMGVEKLIIPAISEHMNTWTSVFSFHQLEDNDKKEIKSMNMLVFPGTDMLQKQLAKQENCAGTKDFNPKKIKLQHHGSENPRGDASLLHRCVEKDPEPCAEPMIEEHVRALNSDFSAIAAHSNAEVAATSSEVLCESVVHLASEAIVVNTSEATNEQKDSSSALVGTSSNCESKFSSDSENPLVQPVGEENNCQSMEITTSNVSKVNPEDSCGEAVSYSSNESPKIANSVVNQNPLISGSAEVGKIPVNMDSTNGSAPEVESVDGCVKSLPTSPSKTLTTNSTDEINGTDSSLVTCTMKVVTKEPLPQFNHAMDQLTASVPENGLNPYEEPSNECSVNADIKETLAIDADDCKKVGLPGSCTTESAKISCEQIVSAGEINENQLQCSSLLETGESAVKDDSDINCTVFVVREETDPSAETGKLNLEIEASDVHEKIISPITSHEDSQDPSIAEV